MGRRLAACRGAGRSTGAADRGQSPTPAEREIATIYAFDSFPSTTQAGGHPDIFTEFELGSRLTHEPPVPCYCNDPKESSATCRRA